MHPLLTQLSRLPLVSHILRLPLVSQVLRLPLRELSLLAALLGATAVVVWRVQEGRTAVSLKKILIPPIGMASGFSMFASPQCRIPLLWAIGAFLIGATVLAYPLVRTSRLVRDGDAIMMKRSNAFFLVVIVLGTIRVLANGYIDRYVDVWQTGAIFFVLAFGMILHWRLRMFFQYRQIASDPIVSGQFAGDQSASE